VVRYIVRVYREIEEEYTDVEVSAKSKDDAARKAETLVSKDPKAWFSEPNIYYSTHLEYDEVERVK